MTRPADTFQADPDLFVVGLTGGIASGKSAVSRRFEELGAGVIDTDVIARQLVEPGQPLLSSIVAAFGQELLDAYGRLKRNKLRKMIFKNKDQRLRLESLMHPEIAAEASRRMQEITEPYCILVIPLLAEKGGNKAVDRVLVVDADEEVQIQRVMQRDGIKRRFAEASLAAQARREDRLAIADDVIVNHGSIEELNSRVDALHEQYLEMARGHREP